MSAKRTDGTFKVEVFGLDGDLVAARENFTCPDGAREFAETTQRQILFNDPIDGPTPEIDWNDPLLDMTDPRPIACPYETPGVADDYAQADELAECDGCGMMLPDVTTVFSPTMGDTSACAACRGEEE